MDIKDICSANLFFSVAFFVICISTIHIPITAHVHQWISIPISLSLSLSSSRPPFLEPPALPLIYFLSIYPNFSTISFTSLFFTPLALLLSSQLCHSLLVFHY